MRTLLAIFLGCALATPAVAGPDFTTRSPRAHSLAASPASSEIGPLDDVVFATNSTQLTDSALTQIATAARWLQRNRDHRIVIEGYADDVGVALYNEDLAKRRASVVRQELIRNGVAPDRTIVVVFGEERALGGDQPLDRRVVLYATKQAPQQIATASFRVKNALSATWTRDRALFTETRDRRTVIGTR